MVSLLYFDKTEGSVQITMYFSSTLFQALQEKVEI